MDERFRWLLKLLKSSGRDGEQSRSAEARDSEPSPQTNTEGFAFAVRPLIRRMRDEALILAYVRVTLLPNPFPFRPLPSFKPTAAEAPAPKRRRALPALT